MNHSTDNISAELEKDSAKTLININASHCTELTQLFQFPLL